MDINEFSFVVNVCGGKDKDFIRDFLNKRYKNKQDFLVLFRIGKQKGIFNKKLKYSFENLVNELARQENMENFDWSKIEFEDY